VIQKFAQYIIHVNFQTRDLAKANKLSKLVKSWVLCVHLSPLTFYKNAAKIFYMTQNSVV